MGSIMHRWLWVCDFLDCISERLEQSLLWRLHGEADTNAALAPTELLKAMPTLELQKPIRNSTHSNSSFSRRTTSESWAASSGPFSTWSYSHRILLSSSGRGTKWASGSCMPFRLPEDFEGIRKDLKGIQEIRIDLKGQFCSRQSWAGFHYARKTCSPQMSDCQRHTLAWSKMKRAHSL